MAELPSSQVQQAVLTNARRPGWVVTGHRAYTQPVQKIQSGLAVTVQEPTGEDIWDIASPDGAQVDTIRVKPPTQIGEVVPWPTDAGGNPIVPPGAANQDWVVTQGPTHEVPAPSSTAPSRPPEPNVSTTAQKIPVWNEVTKQYDWVDNPNYTAGGTTTTRPPEPNVSTTAPQIPVWNETTKRYEWQANPNYTPPKSDKNVVHVVGNQLVDDGGKVVFTAPQDWKFETAQDGTILAIDPANPANKQVIWSPTAKATTVTGVTSAQPNILQQQADGTYTSVPNPIYKPAAQQRFQDLHDGITSIEGMLSRGELSYDQANQYKQALRQNFDASLLGTTPYQQFQDKQARAKARMESGAGLLNQRVSSGSGLAESLLSSAVGLAGNKNFMDPSAVAGFSPFSGAFNYVTELGGGPDVYSAASNAVKAGFGSEDDPAMALLHAAIGGGGGGTPAASPAAAAPAQPGFGGGPYQGAPNPNVFGSGMGDPATALLTAALSRDPRQFLEHGPPQRGPVYG